MIRIALADDHRLIRQSLCEMLQRKGFEVIHHAANGKELIEGLGSNMPDVVLLDIRMPVMDGFETAMWFRDNSPTTRIMALSSMDMEDVVLKMLAAGAKAFVQKDAEPDELVHSIKQIYVNGAYLTEEITAYLLKNIHHPDVPTKNEDASLLNHEELALIRLVCSEFSYSEIAEKMNLGTRTIEKRCRELCAKLGCKNRFGLILTAIKKGYVTLGD
jgi:two-component system, NarL family, invasion response regulator UvrY